jgi:hypothetical protein
MEDLIRQKREKKDVNVDQYKFSSLNNREKEFEEKCSDRKQQLSSM